MVPATSSQITLVYHQYLRRDPTAAEVSYWMSVNGIGASIDDVVHAILSGEEWRGPVDQYLTIAYTQYLGRNPTAAELAYWEGQIAGGMQIGTAQDMIRNSPEAAQKTALIRNQIVMAYQSWLGRVPHGDELAYWQNAIANGVKISDAFATIQNSPEAVAFARVSQWNDQVSKITDACAQYLGRSPTSNEIADWKTQYASGSDADSIIVAIRNSAEAKAYAFQQTTNKRISDWGASVSQSVIACYQSALGRAPSSSELAYWQGHYVQDGNAQAILDSISNSDEAKQYAWKQSHPIITPTPAPAPAPVVFVQPPASAPAPTPAPAVVFAQPPATGGQFDSPQANLIAQMYAQYLGRQPTGDELHYWLGTGADALALRTQISTSAEAKQYAASHADTQSQAKPGGLAVLGIAATIFSALKGG